MGLAMDLGSLELFLAQQPVPGHPRDDPRFDLHNETIGGGSCPPSLSSCAERWQYVRRVHFEGDPSPTSTAPPYEGERNAAGQMEGRGKHTYASGNVYEGEWKAGLKKGWGKYTFANGDVYSGQFKAGKREGCGKHAYANGDVFEGQWKAGLKEGWGTYTYSNGDVYQGQFKAGKREGCGKHTFANGDVYEGQWRAGLKEGRGTVVRADGRACEGEWKAGLMERWGKHTYTNNEGQSKARKRERRGKHTAKESQSLARSSSQTVHALRLSRKEDEGFGLWVDDQNRVTAVDLDSSAQRAGLLADDVVIQVDGRDMEDVAIPDVAGDILSETVINLIVRRGVPVNAAPTFEVQRSSADL